MHFGAKFLLGFTMPSVNRGGGRPPASPLNPPLESYNRYVEEKVISANNIGAFYKYINKSLSCKSGIGPLFDHKKQLVHDDHERADLLNNFFQSLVLLMMV